jgi:hypothetical protein
MADVYTDRLGLIAQEEGQHANEWGDLLNLNFQRIDSATRGYTKITLAGAESLDANDITTTSSVAQEESFFKFIEFTGTAGTVTVPAENIVWTVYNNTGSDFTFQPSGGTGVTLTNGRVHTIIYGSNGTTFVDVTDLMGVLPGGSDTQFQYNNSGLLGGIAELVYNSGPTTGNLVELTAPSSLTSGTALRIYNNEGAAFTGDVVQIVNDNAASVNNTVHIQHDGFAVSTAGLRIDTIAGYGIIVDSVTGTAINVEATGGASTIQTTAAGSSGSALEADTTTANPRAGYFYSNVASRTTPLVLIHQDNATNTETTLEITQDGSAAHLDLTGSGLGIDMIGGIRLTERADHANTPIAGYGEIWVRNDVGSALIYTDDNGTDYDLTNPSVTSGYTYTLQTGTSYTAADGDFVVASNTGTVTITLPAASVNASIIVKKTGSGGTVTVDGNASETIDGALTYVMSTQYQSVTLISDGSGWLIV